MRLDTSVSFTVGPMPPGLVLGQSRRQREQMLAFLFHTFLQDHGIRLRPLEVAEEASAQEKASHVLCANVLDPLGAWVTLHRVLALEGKPMLSSTPGLVVAIGSAIIIAPDFIEVAAGCDGLQELRRTLTRRFLLGGWSG